MAERALEVREAGPQVTVQDLGRPGQAHLGVPRSGALDGPAHRLANRLVGNEESAATLECLGGQLSFRTRSAVTIAVTEKVLTVSIAVAMICSSSSTEPAARLTLNEKGSRGPTNRAASATTIEIAVKNAARTHTCRPSRRKKDASGLRVIVAMDATLSGAPPRTRGLDG